MKIINVSPMKMSSVMFPKCSPSPLINIIKMMIIIIMVVPQLAPPVKASSNDQPLACHKVHEEGNLATGEKVKEIDKSLQELFEEIKKDAKYEEDCTYKLESGDGTSIVLTELLETLELRRENYERGLWGYCGKEGADNLIQSILAIKANVIEEKGNNNTITMCDRDKLLSCHQNYGKCQCLTDYRSFRNIASVFWNNAGLKEKVLSEQCVLASGSDCPLDSSMFLCTPGTNCMTKDGMLPCTSGNLKKTMSQSKSRQKREEGSTGEGQVNEGSSASESSGSPGGEAVGRDGNSGNDKINDDPSAKKGRYSMSRSDYPSIYCQCTRFKGTDHSGGTQGTFSPYKYSMICLGTLTLSIVRVLFIGI